MLLAIGRRSGLSDADARDVVQETLAAFAEGLDHDRYDHKKGRLRSWLRGIAINKIQETRRRLARQEANVSDQSDGASILDHLADERRLSGVFEKEWERAVWAECLRQVRGQVDPQTFRAFELYAMEGWPAQKVADHLSVARNVVYVSKSRVLSRLRAVHAEIAETW